MALRIFLTIPVTEASCERSFSKLKIIKNYLRSSIGQERLSGLAIISIENNITETLSYERIVNEFASCKARKVKF
jgi:hAT family C-terminal dimerisation region